MSFVSFHKSEFQALSILLEFHFMDFYCQTINFLFLVTSDKLFSFDKGTKSRISEQNGIWKKTSLYFDLRL